MNDRLYRSRDDRVLAGVAGGLAEYWDADPSLIRLVWALLMLFTGGLALIVYIVMAIVVPEDPGLAGRILTAAGDALAPGSDRRSQRAASRAAAREARRAARAARAGDGPRVATMIVGGALVLFGLWFLLEEYLPGFDSDWFLPVALVGLGALILVAALWPRSERPEVLPPPPASAGRPDGAPDAGTAS
jgi:phage shock protein C